MKLLILLCAFVGLVFSNEAKNDTADRLRDIDVIQRFGLWNPWRPMGPWAPMNPWRQIACAYNPFSRRCFRSFFDNDDDDFFGRGRGRSGVKMDELKPIFCSYFESKSILKCESEFGSEECVVEEVIDTDKLNFPIFGYVINSSRVDMNCFPIEHELFQLMSLVSSKSLNFTLHSPERIEERGLRVKDASCFTKLRDFFSRKDVFELIDLRFLPKELEFFLKSV